MNDFRVRLKELRLENQLSCDALGKIIGVSHGAVNFWENGINEPKISYLIKLCDYFHVSADYLLGRTDY